MKKHSIKKPLCHKEINKENLWEKILSLRLKKMKKIKREKKQVWTFQKNWSHNFPLSNKSQLFQTIKKIDQILKSKMKSSTNN